MAQTEPYRARKDGVVTLASQELYAEMECTQCYTRYNNFTQSAAATWLRCANCASAHTGRREE